MDASQVSPKAETDTMNALKAQIETKQREIRVLHECNPNECPAVEVAGCRVVGNDALGFVVAKPPPPSEITEELRPLGGIFRTFALAQDWAKQREIIEKKIHASGQELQTLMTQSYEGSGIEATEAARLAQFHVRQQPEWDIATERDVINATREGWQEGVEYPARFQKLERREGPTGPYLLLNFTGYNNNGEESRFVLASRPGDPRLNQLRQRFYVDKNPNCWITLKPKAGLDQLVVDRVIVTEEKRS